jgi:hypothetical protein
MHSLLATITWWNLNDPSIIAKFLQKLKENVLTATNWGSTNDGEIHLVTSPTPRTRSTEKKTQNAR